LLNFHTIFLDQNFSILEILGLLTYLSVFGFGFAVALGFATGWLIASSDINNSLPLPVPPPITRN